MTGPEQSALADQVIDLQLLVTHLQRDLESMNQVIIDQQRQIDKLQQLLLRIDDRLIRMSPDSETFDPQSERPPHY